MTKKRGAFTVAIAGVFLGVLMCFAVLSVNAIAGSVGFTVISGILCVVAAGLFAWHFPAEKYTRTPGVSRIFAVVSALCAVVARALTSSTVHYGIALFLLMFMVVAAGFLFEMLRKDRAELIKSLSDIILLSTVGLVSSGWMTLPEALEIVGRSTAGMKVAASIVAIVAVVVIALCVALWSLDAYEGETPDAQNVSQELSENTRAQVWGYSGAIALLCGVLPLLISLVNAVVNSMA